MNISLSNDQERTLRITLQQPLINADRIIRYLDIQIESGIHSQEVAEIYNDIKRRIQSDVDHSKLLRLMLLEEE